jgi:SAM-dependent methyltransferase
MGDRNDLLRFTAGTMSCGLSPSVSRVGSFEELVADAERVPLGGFDFSWFEGRATEQRPSWGYLGLASQAIGTVGSVLDVETGGGEVFGQALERAPSLPVVVAATETWTPNLAFASRRLKRFGALVVRTPERGPLPFATGSFELVISRHPVAPDWTEIARVLAPGGTYLSQQVGESSNRELYERLMGPQPGGTSRSARRARDEAESAGLQVTRLEDEALEVVFFDVGAVVHFLRKVPWTVPGFTVSRYWDELRGLHDEIERTGRFVTHARRMLVEAVKPTGGPP